MAIRLETLIGLRYLRARQKSRFISFISFASVAGILLGVAALIVVLSVMNGFGDELRDRLLGMTSHVVFRPQRGALADWRQTEAHVRGIDGVVAAAPFVSAEAMLVSGGRLHGARIRGILPEQESRVSDVGRFMVQGSLEALQAGSHRVVLGRVLALELGVSPGDRLRILVPRVGADGMLANPVFRSYQVAGVFEAGLQEPDELLALVSLADAEELTGSRGASGIRLRLANIFGAPRIAREGRELLGAGFVDSDWTRDNASYFRAIGIEKTMMTLILLLVVAVAVFNVVASLMMSVTEKRVDIAILRTLGLEPPSIMRIFALQGLVLGGAGTLLGVIVGVALALNVETVVPWLENTLGFQIMPADVYYVTEVPSNLEWHDVVVVVLAALVLTGISSLYPSRRAAATLPAEALRYDA